MLKRTISILIIIGFLSEQAGFAQVAGPMPAPASSGFVYADKFRPVHLRSVDFGRSPGSLNVLLDKGDVKGSKQPAIEQAARDLMTYFFIGVQLPDSSFWVNLRPDSPDRIIDDSLAKTDIGRIMLAADVQLKKDLASCTSPKTKEGREYWNKLYKKAEELFGSEDISIPTVTRPWIVPDEIILRDAGTNAYIYKATLKVLLESDYLKDNSGMQIEDTRFKTLNDYSSQIIRESILPKLSKDVNISKRYAPLRQVYYSLILAQWLKAKFKNAPGTPDMANLTSTTPWSKNTYFNQYRDSFQKGEYNVQETTQTPYGRTIRQYFSGGIKISGLDAMTIKSPLSGPSILAINADPSINPAVYLANSQKARIVMRDGGFETKLLTDDIVAGVAGGDIVMLSEKLKDKFSIFDKGLDWTNTRRWPDMVVYLLKAFMARYPEKLRVMVLGPGSGLELTHIDDIAREQNHQVEIDTMSLTALPRFRLLKSAQEIRHMIVDYLKKDPRNSLSGLVEYYELFLTKPLSDPSSINRGAFIDYILSEDVPVPMSAIPVLQNSGFDVYDVLSGPFINRQFIMSLQDSAIPGAGPGKKYDIILDNRGGFYYTVLNEGLQEAVRVLEPLLDTNGIFYADIVPWMEGETDDITFDNIMIFVKSAHPYSMVIIRKDSVHAAQARALARNADKVSDSVYRVDDMNAFVKAIIPAGPGNEGISRDGGVEDLRSMVKNSKDAIRENIADVLRHFGTNEYTITIKPLIDKLKNRKLLDNVRYDALMSLAGFNDKSVFKALVNELKDDKNSTFIRVNIVRILGQQRDPAAIDVLIEMFQSRDGYIHNAAANELLDVGNPAVPQLIGLMQNESLYRSLSAASLLGKIGDPRAAGPLMEEIRKGRDDPAVFVSSIAGSGAPGLEALIELLRSEDPSVRYLAIQELGSLGDVRAVEPLIALLYTSINRDEEISAINALGALKDPQAVEVLNVKLQYSDEWRVRAYAAKALGLINDPLCVEPLIRALSSDRDSDVRNHIVESLVNLGPLSVPPMIDRLSGRFLPLTRMRAVIVLGKIRDPSALKPLIYALGDELYEASSAVIDAIAQYGPSAVTPLLRAFRVKKLRKCIIQTLGDINDDRTVKPLIAALQLEDNDVRSAALKALGMKRAPEALTALIGVFVDTDAKIRGGAVEAVSEYGRNATGELLRALEYPSDTVQQCALGTLSLIKDPVSTGPVIRVLETSLSDEIRKEALITLGKIRDKSAFDSVASALTDKNPEIRERAANALGYLNDARALEPLIDAFADNSASVAAGALRSLRDLFLPGQNTAAWRDVIERIRMILDVCNGAGVPVSDFCGQISDILIPYAKGLINDKKVKRDLKNIRNAVTLAALYALGGMSVERREFELFARDDPKLLDYFSNLISVYYQIHEEDVCAAENLREAFKQILIIRDRDIFNRWLYTESALNKPVYENLVRAGYNPMLWSEGIKKILPSGEGMTDLKESIYKQTYQLIEIAQLNKIAYPAEIVKLVTYNEAETFAKNYLFQNDDIRQQVERILHDTRALEHEYRRKAGLSAQVTVEIKFDFLNDSYAGNNVPGCFSPVTGIHKEMPLIHALEADAVFLNVYNHKEILIANAVLFLTDEGIVVQPLYNSTNLDIDRAVFEVMAELLIWEWVPAFLMENDSAGFEAAAEYLEIDYTDSRKKLYAQEEDSYYVDTGDVEDDHVIFETGYRLTAGNLRERGYTPLQELFLNKNKTGPKDAKKKDSKRAMVHALFDFCREAGLLYVDLGPVIKNIEEIYDGQADLEKILNLLVTRAPPGNSVSAEARSILRDYLADIQDSPEIQRDGGIVDSLYYAKFAFNLMGARIERATIRHLVNNARSLPRPDARAYMDELMLLCRELGTIHSSPRNKDTVLRMLEDTAKNREEWLSKQLVLSSALRKTIGLLRDTGISGLADSDGFYDAPVLIENLIEYNSRRKNLVEHVNRLIPYMAAQELDPDYMSCILLNLSSSLWSWGIENLSDQDACSRFARVASLMLNVEANHGKAARILMNALRIKDGMLIQENILTQGLMQHSSSETIRTMFEAVFDLYEEKLCEGSRAGLAQQDRARLFVKNVNAVQRAMGRLFIPYHPHRKEDERYLYFSLAGNDVFALEDTLNLDEIDENSLGEFLEEYCTRKDLKTLYSKITDLSLYMRTEGLPSGQVIRVLSGLLARGRKTSANLKQFKEILPVLNAQSRANIIFISRLLGNGAFSERFYRMLVRNNGDLTPVMKALLFPKRSNESNERFRKIFIEELAECAGDYELNQDQFDILWHAFSFSQDKTRQYYLLGDMIAQEAGLKNPGISLPRELREALETADPIRLSVNSRVNKAANFARFGHKIPPVFYDQKIGYNVFCDMAERFGDFNKVAKLFVLIQKLFAEGISHFTIENLFMNVCLVEFAPSDILLNFLLEEENKVLLKEKVALAQHMIVNRADPDILSYIIKFGELKINHKDELSYYRGINAMLVNKAMSSDDGIEDWHIFLNGYIPAFGYLANPDLVRVHRSLAKEAPLDSEELKKYNLAKIGITATGREGIGQFGAVIARMSRDIISQRQLDASYLDSPLTEAMVGAMTSFYTGFGHGANGAFTLKGFVQEFNRARNNGKIPALDKAYLQEDDFDAHKKKARTEFMKETVKLFSYYQNVLCQASELVEKYSVPDRVSLMKARLRESIDKRMQALNAGLADNTSLQKKDFIRQEIDVLTQLKEKTARSNDLLDISVIIADSLLSRAAMLRDDLIICLIAYTFEAYPNVKDEAMPGIKKGLSIGALDKIIELKEVFIKEHILEGLEKNTKRLILKNILNIEQFKKEIDNEELFGDTTSVHVFSTKGIFGEMAGDIGDACYTKENLIMGRKDLTAVLFTTGEGLDIRFIGSMLVLENSYKGKKALILRAINPTDAFIEEYSTADFIKGAIGYARKIAAANGNAVIVAPVGSEHALTNRHGYVDKEMEKYVADKELIALDKKEDFNGYGITRLCAVISAEPESAAQRDGGNFTDESRQGAPGSEGLSTVEADINPSAGAPVSLEEYRNDIRASEKRGDIKYYTAKRNIDDEFAPEQGLKTTNTRGLEKVRAILDILLDDASRTGTALSVVDIGAGSGEACLEAYKAAKAAGVRLIMQTIGLTPIPSRLALKQTADGIRKIIAEIVLAKKLKANPAVKEYLSTLKHLKGKDLDSLTENGIGPVYYDSRVIPMSLAFTLQAGGHEIFERLNEPYIQKQHIGRLTEIDIDQQFDLVYDQWGGFNYSVQEIGLQETLEKTLPLLSGKGILFVESLPEFLMYKLKSINVPEGFTIIAFGPRNRRGMIAFRKGSPYERRLGRLLAPNKRLGEVYVIEDLSGIVDRLRNVKADVQAGKDGGAAESDMLDWTNRKNLENIAPEDNYIKDTNSLAAGKASWVVFDDESTVSDIFDSFEKKIAYWGVSFPFEYRADEDASEDPFTRIMLEELKNAYDAQASFYDSIWRASSGIRKPENYTPEITVFFELIRRDENPVLKITVRDNGAGKKAADTARKRNEALEKMFSKYMGKAGGGDAWAIDLITRLWDLAGGIRPQKIFSRTFPEYGTDTVMYLPAKYAQFNKSGSETGMFISDTGQIAALRNVYEIIERDRINKPLSEDPAVTPAGDGSECSVYVVSGYKHVVFKIAHEYLDEYRFKFQTDNIAKIIRAKGSRRIRKDMFDLVSTPHIAPFAYLSFRSEAGKRVNMTVQQKAAMPATASDCENLEAGLRESGIDWADIMPNNAGMLETEYSGRNTPVPAVLDLGDLYLEDAVPPMIEMLFNSPHPDDRFHAACVLGTRGDPRALEPMKEALAKEQDESVREALSIYLGFFSANQDGGEGETLSAGEPDLSNIFPVAVDREMYLEDLYSAYMRGEIMEFPGAVDKFSPLRVGLMRDNSRGLAEGFIDYLKEAFLRGRDSGVPIRILVLGHGSGRECAQIYELAREYGCRVIIDAIGLTAIPPSIYLKIDAPELMRLAGQYTRDTDRAPAGWQQYIEDENDPVISSTRKSGVVSLITAFDLSNHFGIFDVFPQPFINKQYIGTLNSIETEGVYDIIYDNNGAARYEFLENGVAVTMSTIKRMLDPQGAFYMEDLPNRREYFAQLSSDPDLNVAAAGILNQTIVSFNDSLLQREAERGLVPRLQLDGGTMNDKVAGIDLRGLPAFSGQDGVHGILPSDAHLSLANRIMARLGKAESASQPADLDKEWSKIEQTVNSGAIPDTASLEGYVRACCQSGRIAAERDKVLLCIAGILRMEEDLSVSTEPQLKELLVLLDSPALS